MTKAQLIEELRTRDAPGGREQDLEQIIHELHVHQEEVKAQHAQLLQAQHALETSRDKYVDLYDFAPVGYVTLSCDGIIEEINLTGARLLGTERARIVGLPFHVYVVKEERRAFLDYLQRCRGTATPGSFELRLASKIGSVIPVQLSARRSASNPEDSRKLNVAIVDLSESKRAEAERYQSIREVQAARDANEAKDRFLAMLSHELRTPLTPTLYAIHSLQAAGIVPAAWEPTLEMIRRNTELEARLIDDLLDVTRITRGKLQIQREIADVHGIVHDVLEMCASELAAAKLELALSLAAEQHHVHGDHTRLRQVFWNLLRNAIKATPAGGRITVRSFNDARDRVTLAVSDTGIGMDVAALERIFLPFEQAEAAEGRGGGLGLGLTISKGLIEAHQGRIRAMSRGKGMGATFEIELATVAPPAPALAPTMAAPGSPQRVRRMRILLVEDHEDTAEILADLLVRHGHEILVARSLCEARALMEQRWDVLLTDLGLPDGSGLDLLRELRASRPVKAIALSGYGRDEDIRESMDAGFLDHLTKPVDFQQLVDALERVAAG